MADERDRGTLDLLLACPVTPGEIVAGKYLGLALALVGATAGGFGAAGAVLVLRMGFAGIGSYVLFTGNAVLLGLVFLGFAFLLSVFIRERSKVMAVSVFLWLVLALLYDLGLIGLLILSGGRVPEGVFAGLLAANPIDLFRLMGFLAVGETKMFVGLAAIDFPRSHMAGPLGCFPRVDRRAARDRGGGLPAACPKRIHGLNRKGGIGNENVDWFSAGRDSTCSRPVPGGGKMVRWKASSVWPGRRRPRRRHNSGARRPGVRGEGASEGLRDLQGRGRRERRRLGRRGRRRRLSRRDIVMSNDSCRVSPRVAVGLVGSDFVFKTDGARMHNFHLYLQWKEHDKVSQRPLKMGATVYNVAFPKGDREVRKPIKPFHTTREETGIIKARCNLHPWEEATLLVFDHPYAAVTDTNGKFSLPDVPPGKYTLKWWHEGLGSGQKAVEVKGVVKEQIELKAI